MSTTSTSQVRQPQRPLRILSLDGGGVRGLSSLIILREIVAKIQHATGDSSPPLPCGVFELIVGTGTGGISALLLGRMRLSIDQAIEEYVRMATDVFRAPSLLPQLSVFRPGMLDHEALAKFLDQTVRNHMGDSDTLLFDPATSSDPSRCRTAVLAATSSSLDAPPYIFRSYSATPEFKITDVARATSATAGIFAPVSLSYPPMQFIDAGSAGYNNPTEIALDEAHKLWPERNVDLLLSIGTGSQRIVNASQDKLVELSQRLMSSCEAVHERVCRRLVPTQYFRFSVPQGLEDIGGKAWAEIGLPGRVAEITAGYLRKAEPSHNLFSCVQKIVGMHAQHNVEESQTQSSPGDSVVLTVSNLIPMNLNSGRGSEAQVRIPISATQKDVADALVNAGFRGPEKFKPDMVITVTLRSDTNVPGYDGSLPEGLTIIPSQTPMDWFIGYLKFHRIKHPLVPDNQFTEATLSGNIIVLPGGDGKISFHRTLRVPDDGKIYALPPDLGNFPLLPVKPYARNLPESVTKRGGFFLPMYQREALWIRLPFGHSEWQFSDHITRLGVDGAFKIAVGGINAVSGISHESIANLSADAPQDYLSGKTQPWLDGIAARRSVIKQFVAMPLGQGYTIEEQLLGSTNGGIQIDFYPRLDRYVSFYAVSSCGNGDTKLVFHDPISRQLEDGDIMGIWLEESTRETMMWDSISEHLIHAGPVPLVAHYPIGIPQPVMQHSSHTLHARDDNLTKCSRSPLPLSKNVTHAITPLHQAPIRPDSPQPGPSLYSLPEKRHREIQDLPRRSCSREPASLPFLQAPPHHHYSITRKEPYGGPSFSQDGLIPMIIKRSRYSSHLCSGISGEKKLNEENLGLGAGGLISQKIYADELENFECYAQHPLYRILVHVVSTTTWELVTGTLPPPTSVSRLLYDRKKIPWFKIYDEHIPGISQGGKFENVQTVEEIDRAHGTLAEPGAVNANNPPNPDPSILAKHEEQVTSNSPPNSGRIQGTLPKHLGPTLHSSQNSDHTPCIPTAHGGHISINSPDGIQRTLVKPRELTVNSPLDSGDIGGRHAKHGEHINIPPNSDRTRGTHAKPRELNADSPPKCDLCSTRVASVVFRPCTHCVCGECLNRTVSGGSTCLTCSNRVFGYIGFRKPAKYCISNKSDQTLDISSTFIDAPTADSFHESRVITIHLPEDEPAGLYFRDAAWPRR